MNTKMIAQLVERMLSFSGNFDGYPTMTCSDENLIHEACVEFDSQNQLCFLCYLASEHARTPEQYKNAKAYIDAYVECTWQANMCEGLNPIHEA